MKLWEIIFDYADYLKQGKTKEWLGNWLTDILGDDEEGQILKKHIIACFNYETCGLEGDWNVLYSPLISMLAGKRIELTNKENEQ